MTRTNTNESVSHEKLIAHFRKTIEGLPSAYRPYAQAVLTESEEANFLDDLVSYVRNHPDASAGRILGRSAVLASIAQMHMKLDKTLAHIS